MGERDTYLHVTEHRIPAGGNSTSQSTLSRHSIQHIRSTTWLLDMAHLWLNKHHDTELIFITVNIWTNKHSSRCLKNNISKNFTDLSGFSLLVNEETPSGADASSSLIVEIRVLNSGVKLE